MKRLLILLFLLLGSATIASAKDSLKGWCEEGNRPVVTSGLNSTTRVQASHPSCTITVYIHGGGLATIFADNNNTPLANPFTAQSGGRWQAYSQNGRYDVVMSSAGFTQTVTYSDIILCDPFETGSTCNNGGATQAHNLLSTTHLDTIPASPPVRGDLITAQNQTSPTGVNPSWARLPLGSAGQVLLSNGLDAIWSNLVAGTGITVTNTGSPSGSTITIATTGGGGGSVPCTTSVAGTWDIIPQTCAGEKVLQGIAGNPAITNLVLTPASDQTAINSYFGDAASNFSAITTLQADAPLTNSFHVAASYNRANASSPFFSSFLGYNESNNTTVGGGNPVFGVRCIGVESGTRITTTVQACEGEGFNNGTQASGNSVNVLDAFSGFVSSGPNAQTILQADFYASRNVGTPGSTRTRNNHGLFVERQQGVGLNNYSIFATGPTGLGPFFVAADTGHVNVGVLDSAQLKGLCYNTGAVDTSATFVISTCLQDTPSTLASIGTCNAGNEGATATVTNSTTNTIGAVITGGGSLHVLAYCNGTNWVVAGGSTTSHGLVFTIGDPGNSSALTVASTTTTYLRVPFACTIKDYSLMIDAGTITVKFWKVATGTAIPTSGNSINTSGVSISSGTAIRSTTLSDFTTTTVAANDFMAMNVTAVATAKFVNGVLSCQE